MSLLVVVMLATLVHYSCAISCYVCRSKTEPACDDPFNRNSTGVHTLSCPGNACSKVKGRVKDDQVWFTGVVRGCGTAAMIECSELINQPVPELHLTDAIGELCYCTGNLCNTAQQTSFDHRFDVTCLITLVISRFLGQ